jgi:hypothetical protein
MATPTEAKLFSNVGASPAAPLTPPAPTAKAVRAHRKKLEAVRDGLRTGAAELALASALGDADAKAALAGIPAKFAALQFEIDLNHEAYELAHKQDADAETAWRASLQTMDPADIIEGIGKECCPRNCTPGVAGGCVISAGAPHAGGTCVHPVRERDIFYINSNGKREFQYRHSARASAVFDAACEKLKVRGQFA